MSQAVHSPVSCAGKACALNIIHPALFLTHLRHVTRGVLTWRLLIVGLAGYESVGFSPEPPPVPWDEDADGGVPVPPSLAEGPIYAIVSRLRCATIRRNSATSATGSQFSAVTSTISPRVLSMSHVIGRAAKHPAHASQRVCDTGGSLNHCAADAC